MNLFLCVIFPLFLHTFIYIFPLKPFKAHEFVIISSKVSCPPLVAKKGGRFKLNCDCASIKGFLIIPRLLSSLPDQHEDDACRDVPTADGTGDACLHIESLHGSARCSSACLAVWRRRQTTDDRQVAQLKTRRIYFSIILFFSASCCNAVKNIPFSFSGFISYYIVIMALKCEYSCL